MKTALLLFGGESTEHDVSVASAVNVSQAIDPEQFIVAHAYIDREGTWWSVGGVNQTLPDNAKQLLPVLGKKSFIVEGTTTVIYPDVIVPVLHGVNGEDGSVAALGRLVHVPVVGCDMTASAIAMNKYATKQLAAANGMNIVPFILHAQPDDRPNYDDVTEQLGATLFIKPVSTGSSVGVHKVTNQTEFHAALTDAHLYDNNVLIEKAISARELEVAVLGNYPTVAASAVSEVQADGEFYTYDSKYADTSASQVIIPADITDELSDSLRNDAIRIFTVLGGSGLARVDFFVDKDTQTVYLNEVNTFPGFTNISVYPKAWEHAGLSYTDLVGRLIQLAIDKN